MPNPEGTAISQRSLRNFPSLKIDGENENVWKFNFLHCQTLKYSKIQRNLWLIFPFSLFHISAFLITSWLCGLEILFPVLSCANATQEKQTFIPKD